MSDLVTLILLALGGLAAVAGYGVRQRKRGRDDERQQAGEADHEHADDIRRRVERDADQRLRRYDDAGWRD